jgi:hypothetical protein
MIKIQGINDMPYRSWLEGYPGDLEIGSRNGTLWCLTIVSEFPFTLIGSID